MLTSIVESYFFKSNPLQYCVTPLKMETHLLNKSPYMHNTKTHVTLPQQRLWLD